MKEDRLMLSKEEKRELGIDFEGDVYCCEWKQLPPNLKTKTKLDETGLNPPEQIEAKILTKIGLFDLYDLNKAKKKGSYDGFKTTRYELTNKEWVSSPTDYVVLDTETTGVCKKDEVIQLSIASLNGEVLFNSYFKPTVESHPRALKVHKITHEFLRDKPLFKDKWEEIERLLIGKTIIIHNEIFDVRLLSQTCQRYGITHSAEFKTCCSMRYFQRMIGISKLEDILKELGVKQDDKPLHNSLTDCEMLVKALNSPY